MTTINQWVDAFPVGHPVLADQDIPAQPGQLPAAFTDPGLQSPSAFTNDYTGAIPAALRLCSPDDQASALTIIMQWPTPASGATAIRETTGRLTAIHALEHLDEATRYSAMAQVAGQPFTSSWYEETCCVPVLASTVLSGWANPTYPAVIAQTLNLSDEARARLVWAMVRNASTTLELAEFATLAPALTTNPQWTSGYSEASALPMALVAGMAGAAVVAHDPDGGLAELVHTWLSTVSDGRQSLAGFAAIPVSRPLDQLTVEMISAVVADDPDTFAARLQQMTVHDGTALPTLAHNLAEVKSREGKHTFAVLAATEISRLSLTAHHADDLQLRTHLAHTVESLSTQMHVDMAAIEHVEKLWDVLVPLHQALIATGARGRQFPDSVSVLVGCSRRLGWRHLPLPVTYVQHDTAPNAAGLRAVGHEGVDAIATYLGLTDIPAPARRGHVSTLRAAVEADPACVLDVHDDAWVGVGRLTVSLPTEALHILMTQGGPKGRKIANRALSAFLD